MSSFAPSGGLARTGARAHHSAAVSVPNVTTTTQPLDSERYDEGGLHDNVTNNSRLTFPASGKVLIVGHLKFAADADGHRRATLRLNGTTEIARGEQASNTAGAVAGTDRASAAALHDVVAGDYVELQAEHNGGAALDSEVVLQSEPELAAHYIAG